MKSALQLLTAHAAAEILYGMCRSGVMDGFRKPITASEFARRHRLEEAAVETVLEFLTRSTDLFLKKGGKYGLAPRYVRNESWQALIFKFVGAYGPVMRDPIGNLGDRDRAGACIGAAALTRAFADGAESKVLIETILGFRPKGVLDIGCGQGSLLGKVSSLRPVRGWGIDKNPSMCRSARQRLSKSELRGSVTIRCGDVEDLPRLLSRKERSEVDVICACSLLNEWMASESRAVAMLHRLGRLFPGRPVVVMDYLGSRDSRSPAGPYTRLTDLSQALSGQGVPPGTHRGWQRIYEAASARLASAVEGRTLDLRWFLHVVVLPGPNGAQKAM